MGAEQRKMTPEEMEKAAWDLIYLLKCGIWETAPELEKVERMDLEQVHAVGSFHSLTAIAAMALESACGGKLPQTERFQAWAQEKDRALYRNLLFDMEREQVTAFLERSGIWYLPLKGILLQTLYPKPGMRQMADNDILFDQTYREQVHDWFLARGYTMEGHGGSNHDAYHKAPVYNFEMHVSLFGAQHPQAFQDYYADVATRLIRDEGGCGRHFQDEDAYVYIVAHACKHYSAGGTGLRSLLDLFVYCRAKAEAMDWEYIRAQLDALDIREFEQTARCLSQKLFARQEVPEALSQEEQAMLQDLIGSGTYGTVQNHVRNQLRQIGAEEGVSPWRAKLRYFWRRSFPEPEIFYLVYPFFGRHRWLLPVGYVFRWFDRAIHNGSRIRTELQSLLHSGKK